MTDVVTTKQLHVLDDSVAGPYLRLSMDQLEKVRQLLDSHGIFYWFRENSISMDGGPFFTVVNFGRNGDAAAMQALLDSVE